MTGGDRSSLQALTARLPAGIRARLKPLLPTGLVHRRVRWGTLRRSVPFDREYGTGRGTPVDRIYIEDFIASCKQDIRGEVLEVGESRYTDRFGEAVTAKHVVDVDANNPNATIIGDLTDPATLPRDRYDCFILTQTLHLLEDPSVALRNAYASIRPGGSILVTVPSLSRISPSAGAQGDRWRFTPAGLAHLLEVACPEGRSEVIGRGNLLAGVAFLMGIAAEELTPEELALDDDSFPLLACGRVVRPAR